MSISTELAAPRGMQRAEEIDLDTVFAKPGLYVLRMRGESMADAHILDGDYVVVDPAVTPVDGDKVVVHIIDSSETTLKFWHPTADGRVRLAPGNGRMPDRMVDASRVESKGVVVGVLRQGR